MEKRYKYILFKIVSFFSVYVAIEKGQKMSLSRKNRPIGRHSWQAKEEMVDRVYTEKTPETKCVWEHLVMDERICGDYANLKKTELY